MAADADRRPISQRSHGWAKWLTSTLVKSGVTPNFISFTSIVFASLAGLCFYGLAFANDIIGVILCFLAALFCQLRLLANMMDGMVAVEGGKASKDGMIWNELPDRLADIAVLVGAGCGVAAIADADGGTFNPSFLKFGLMDTDVLGWAAAVAAVMTAYVREVGKAAGAPPDFSGPMAKPHRMFVMTIAALLAATTPLWGGPHVRFFMSNDAAEIAHIIHGALWIVLIGSILTTFSRAWRALRFLRRS
jgi:phosphatidylglycerophosphate synthase